jgi:hypothetical protein
MNPAPRESNLRRPRVVAVLILLAAAAMAAGWFTAGTGAGTFVYDYTLIDPALLAILCVLALRGHAKHPRWLATLSLLGMMLDVARYPHHAGGTAIGCAAGVVGIVATLLGYNRIALVAALLCSTAVSAALLAGRLAPAV